MAAVGAPRTKADVTKILDTLDQGEGVSSQESDGLLKHLHASTRVLDDPELEPLFSKRGVRTLGAYAFQETPKPEHLPALKCLNNVLVRSSSSSRFLSSEIGAAKIVSLLKRNDPEDELALANIVIFSCHGTSLDLSSAFENDGLADAVNAIIARNVKEGLLPTSDPTSGCSASLRLLSVLAARYEPYADLLLDSVGPVMDMLPKLTVLSPPLQPPVSLLVNCMPVLPLEKSKDISAAAGEKVVEILRDCISFYGTEDNDKDILPLLLGVFKLSQSQSTEAKDVLKKHLLPTDEDRKQVLGKGTTLPHQMLSMTNNSLFQERREAIMSTYFELSDKNPSHFVHNVGFGNAAGYLSAKGIQITQQDMEVGASGVDVNPITGQRIDSEPDTVLPEMTDEEKEREAERLFVLFERLRATGVVDVENPVTRMMQSGTVQELPDSDTSDDELSKPEKKP